MIPGADSYGVELDISQTDIEDALSIGPGDVSAASELSYARNVFIPVTTACKYNCGYCTYVDAPGEASLLSPDEIRTIVERGARAGCTEALFTFGDEPDGRYEAIYSQLSEWGYDSFHDYLADACEIALEAGLLPHSNPGDQTADQMASIQDLNASMGVMLETTAELPAHAGPRGKSPGQRLATIRAAGELSIPFTTGILVGIGESWRDRAISLLAIRELHARYGHVQEVIVQPVSPNERWSKPAPALEIMRRAVSMARAVLPASISVQVPPNLAPVDELLDCGIDDLGGVSPVTSDHINPDYAWPGVRELESIAAGAGVPLRERLPVYSQYLEWVSPRIRDAIDADTSAGARYRSVLAD